ncbi:MAG: glycosyltransferase, partial [Pseudomonadota bacterium]
ALKALSSTTPIDMVEFYDYCGPAYYSLAEAGQGGMPPVAVRLHNTVELIARRVRSPLDPDRLLQFGMERAAIAGADMLLAPADAYFREEILALYPEASGVPAQVSPPIHAPVGSVAYDPFANDVAFYGRLSTFKGIDTFMRAAVAALDDPAFERWLGRFLVIGPEETVAGGMSLEALRAMVPARFAERFAFTGRLHHEELFARLQSAAFACFANRIESFCYAAHELATAGMPLILSDTPAFHDHFAEGRDARFFDGTAGALATEMRALAQDAVARAKLSAAGRARIDGYDTTDHYAAHLSALPPSGSGGSEASFDTTVVVFSDGDRVAEARSLATVGERKVLVLERDASGSGWRARDAHARGVNLDRAPAGVAALFLRAGDAVDPDWLSAAERALQGRRTAGAVGGWQRHGDVLRAPGHALLPETALSEAPGLRMIVRLAPGLCWAEALGSMGAAGELPLLLAHRAAGQVLLTLPMPAVDTTDAVGLPAPTLRDVASRDYGLLRHDMLALLAARAPASDRNEDAAGAARAATLADPSLIVIDLIPGSGELLILRAFDGDEGLALPWSSVSLEGDWTSVFDAGGPVDGALRTDDGRLSLRLSEGGRVELLCGPHAGTITVTHRGRTATHALAASEIADGALTIKAGKARFARPTRHENPAGVGSLPLPSAALPLGTVFLAAEPDDFAHWPLSDRILPRQLLLDDFLDPPDAPYDLRAAAEAFASHLERLGVERVVLSSRLPASERLMASLAALP